MRLLRQRFWIGGGLIVAALFAGVDVADVPCGRDHDSTKCYVSLTAKTALWGFRIATGRFPTTAEGLQALITCPPGLEARWRGPYLDGTEVPLDKWGHAYRYRFLGIHNPTAYDVWSLGPDGVESTDDIGNW